MTTLDELETALAAKVQERHKKIESLTRKQDDAYRAEIKDLRAQVQAVLTKGAKACPECGNKPLGIRQPKYFEVGCIYGRGSCPQRHSNGASIKQAVDNWNKEAYFTR